MSLVEFHGQCVYQASERREMYLRLGITEGLFIRLAIAFLE